MINYHFSRMPISNLAQAAGFRPESYEITPRRLPTPSAMTLARAARILVEIGRNDTERNAPGLAFIAVMLDTEYDAAKLAPALLRALSAEADADDNPAASPERYRDPFAKGNPAFISALMEALRPGQQERQKQQAVMNLTRSAGAGRSLEPPADNILYPPNRNPLVDDIRVKREIHKAVLAARNAALSRRPTE